MAQLFKKIYDGYMWLFDEAVDPRLKGYPLIGSPFQLSAIIGLYLYFCLKAGPKFMKNRKPYDVKRIMQAYNLFEICLSTAMICTASVGWYLEGYSLKCQDITYGEPGGSLIAILIWMYAFNKVVELLDTIFFILRKKYNQVTFLHVYHHSFMPIATFAAATWYPGGHGVLMGIINTFIHVIMYSYYFLASLGPEWQKYLWWKKHLTAMQMIQFAIVFVHNVQVLFRECSYPRAMNWVMIIEASIFLYLFGKFYVEKYLSKPDIDQKSKNSKKVH